MSETQDAAGDLNRGPIIHNVSLLAGASGIYACGIFFGVKVDLSLTYNDHRAIFRQKDT